MKKEQKRDNKGRFVSKRTPKVDVSITVEPKPDKLDEFITVGKDEYEQLKLEHDAYKLTSERYMGKYLTVSAQKRALEDKHLYVMDALCFACAYIGWCRSKLTWWAKRINHKKILDMELELDRLVAKAECLDRD